ncbi:MAG: fumarate hydratase [archaeon]
MGLEEELVEVYRKAACELPEDVLAELKKRAGDRKIDTILDNCEIAKAESKPICQDTGTPVWYVKKPTGKSEDEIRTAIESATKRAVEEVPLRANSVCPVTGQNFGLMPFIHFEEHEKDLIQFDLLLKGGGSENIGQTYFVKEMEFSAVKNYVKDAVEKAGDRGCPPYVLGVCVGGSRDIVSYYSKRMLRRKLDDVNKNPVAAEMEKELVEEFDNVMGVKIGITNRHPASYFVDVCFSCWALRRGRLEWKL